VPSGLTRVTVEDGEIAGTPVLAGDVADPTADWPRHDPTRLGAVLRRLA
jgi:hypothetical protein